MVGAGGQATQARDRCWRQGVSPGANTRARLLHDVDKTLYPLPYTLYPIPIPYTYTLYPYPIPYTYTRESAADDEHQALSNAEVLCTERPLESTGR